MLYQILAEGVVVIHFVFIIFVVGGGLLALKWRPLLWVHLAAAAWGAFVEFTGRICPLTPLEKWLRWKAGLSGYEGEFIEHYILPIIYPAGLTRNTQLVLGCAVILINVGAYLFVYRRWSRVR